MKESLQTGEGGGGSDGGAFEGVGDCKFVRIRGGGGQTLEEPSRGSKTVTYLVPMSASTSEYLPSPPGTLLKKNKLITI